MALLRIEGFDHINVDDDLVLKNSYYAYYTNIGTGRDGTGKCLDLFGWGREHTWQFGQEMETFIFGCGVQYQLYNDHESITFQDRNGATQLQIRVNGDGSLAVLLSDETVLCTSAPGAVNISQWHQFEIKATIHPTAGSVEVRLDGFAVCSATGINTLSTAFQSVARVHFYSYIKVDDLYLCDTTGTVNNDFLGVCYVSTVMPDANGSQTDFTPSIGSNWENLDEIPTDGDSTYNNGSTVAARDLFSFDTLPSGIDKVLGVQVSPYARVTDPGARKVNAVAKSVAAVVTGQASPISANYRWYSSIFELDPNTSGLWTPAAVNAAEFGYEIDT